MGDEQEPGGPSLEPPSLFRRQKSKLAPQIEDDRPTTILDDVTATGTTRPLAVPVTAARARTERAWPPVPGRVAAALAGLLVGALIVGLTSASFDLCRWIRGTSSCGGAGLFLLVAILVLAVLLGTAVLRLFSVPGPGSTSFLAVGLTGVIAMLLLVDQLFEWWMVVAIPLVSVLTFLLSHWVTTTFVEPATD
jgi:hypothetical protein